MQTVKKGSIHLYIYICALKKHAAYIYIIRVYTCVCIYIYVKNMYNIIHILHIYLVYGIERYSRRVAIDISIHKKHKRESKQ